MDEAKKRINSYYEKSAHHVPKGTEEADKVSARIVQILRDKTFNFSPASYIHIHGKIFEGVFKFAGKVRAHNITKKEWVLNGDTVLYANADLINETLKYDFETEKNFDYSKLSKEDAVKHITRFVANIWQIHPFGDALVPQGTNVNNFHSCKRRGAAYGNTRTTAVFAIKYLRKLGYATDNKIFEKNSWYFRNALVRANYSNGSKGIYMNTEYLERFFRNLILGENNELKNRYTHIDYDEYIKKFGENGKSSEKKFGDNQKSSEIILELLKENPKLSAKKLSEQIGITSRAVEKQLAFLVEKGFIKREGSPKGGHWEILK